jgi:diguanylate cyclase (GGDEF)-like protein
MARPEPTDGMSPASFEASADLDAQQLLAQTRKLTQINTRFEIALNNMVRGLSMFDADGNLIVCNALYRDLYGLPDELTAPGTPFSRIIAYHAAKDGSANTVDDLERQQAWIEAHMVQRKHGRIFSQTHNLADGRIILVTIQPLRDGGWVDIQEDVTEQTLAQERIAWLARHCPLTEIANRFHLREALEDALDRLKANDMLAVHLIDLDCFKQVNDTLGHAAGDAVLKAAAKRLQSVLRSSDIAGRVGGDEFVIVQTDLHVPEQASRLAERLVTTLSAPYRVLGANAAVGASIGIAIAPAHGTDADTLLRKADLALYRMKACGRGQCYLYTPDDETVALERMELRTALRDALGNQQLGLHYQPIVDVRAGTVTGCEALMRWRHPRLGMVPPSTFIPLAEKSGLIVAMGDWALHQACQDAAGWRSNIKVAVNLSPMQFVQPDLTTSIQHALETSGLEPARLEVEITEQAFLKSEARTIETLHQLRALGVRLVLDDFGAGIASLSHLRSFAFDKIKIDQSFISEMAARRDSMAIIGAVAGLAKMLGIGPVAEGVEGFEQVEGVAVAGCEEMQGFYFSQPVPSFEVEDAVAACVSKLSRGAEAGGFLRQ